MIPKGISHASVQNPTYEFPGVAATAAVILTVITFDAWAWTTRASSDVLVPHDLQMRLRRAVESGPLYSIL
jgi:hypothetical protein